MAFLPNAHHPFGPSLNFLNEILLWLSPKNDPFENVFVASSHPHSRHLIWFPWRKWREFETKTWNWIVYCPPIDTVCQRRVSPQPISPPSFTQLFRLSNKTKFILTEHNWTKCSWPHRSISNSASSKRENILTPFALFSQWKSFRSWNNNTNRNTGNYLERSLGSVLLMLRMCRNGRWERASQSNSICMNS